MAISDGRVVSNFIVQALRNEPITIYGDGSQTRSFMYVSDLLDGMLRMMTTPDDVTGPVNIGNPKETTIRLLADCILEEVNSYSENDYLVLPSDDPKVRCPDITLAQVLFNPWIPRVGLREGLKLTIEYFYKKLNNQ